MAFTLHSEALELPSMTDVNRTSEQRNIAISLSDYRLEVRSHDIIVKQSEFGRHWTAA